MQRTGSSFFLEAGLLRLVLKLIELIVGAALLEKLEMIAGLHDLTVVDDDDAVGMLDRGQPVGDDQHRADVHHFLQGILN